MDKLGGSRMEQVPEWIGNVLLVAMGSVGTMVMAVITTRNKDRTQFTRDVMDRLKQVEEAQRVEREYCERKILELHTTIRERDKIIQHLRDRIDQVEARHAHDPRT